MTYLSFILIIAASILKALMDTLADHFSTSIFKKLNPNFWNKQVSWQGKKFLGIEVLDAWHITQYGFLSFVFAAIIFYKPVFGLYDWLIFWLIYTIIFELFYSKLFIKK